MLYNTTDVEGVGDGSVTGETRKRIVDAMEKTKSLLLFSSLEGHRPRSARHCVAWKQRDKISSSWILALPGVDNSLTNAQILTLTSLQG